MNEIEIQALKEVFGLSYIQNPIELHDEVQKILDSLNPIDQAAIKMKLGSRIQELESMTKGAKYSPPTWTLAIIIIITIIFSAISFYVVTATKLWFVVKLLIGIFCIICFLMAWRSLARIIYRITNGKDLIK